MVEVEVREGVEDVDFYAAGWVGVEGVAVWEKASVQVREELSWAGDFGCGQRRDAVEGVGDLLPNTQHGRIDANAISISTVLSSAATTIRSGTGRCGGCRKSQLAVISSLRRLRRDLQPNEAEVYAGFEVGEVG